MIIIYTILFGLIQGLTEFLPISSTGHLAIFHNIWSLDIASDLGFDVVLHGGTLFALLVYFWDDLVKYMSGFFRSLRCWNFSNDLEQRMSWLVIMGTIPAAVIGYLIENYIEDSLRTLWVIVVALFVGAIVFIISEKHARKVKELSDIKIGWAIVIGLAQAIALIPGVSRSGSTIITGLLFNLKREAAAKFAFLLSIPIVLGAGVKKTAELVEIGAFTQNWLIYVVGFVSSFVSGYLCIKYFLRYLKSNSLNPFAYYRIILSLVLATLIIFGVLS
ncbi:undecaprenyl-diphosphatase UppP [Patescibacteria group bacterium]|nr:undecaprenyl-diphosphatase UppP [Patescibacteria group bacterium]MBU1890820.1 undecaprenyl-diphosphatase UppP [Patescibacteria group bacterium]